MKRSAARRTVRRPARLGTFAVGAILLASCATTPGGESADRAVVFDTYAVPPPKGDGWKVTRDVAKEDVTFERHSTVLADLVASTYIKVVKMPFSGEAAARSEEALANGYLEGEHQDMLERGVARNLYRLGEVKKAVETIGGRKLYTMRYTTEASGPGGRAHSGTAALFLYFPPDYAARRAFYVFLIQELRANSVVGRMVSPDLGRIEPMIAGFTLRAVAPPAGPHPGPPPEAKPPDAEHLGCPQVGGAGDAAGAPRVARWGMTLDEVLVAFPAEAVRPSAAEIRQGSGAVRIDACELVGTTFRAAFSFDKDSRLTEMTLEPSSKRDAGRPLFDRLAKAFTERYGQPTERHDDAVLFGPLRQSDRWWKSDDAAISLIYVDGTGDPFVHVVYHPPRRADVSK